MRSVEILPYCLELFVSCKQLRDGVGGPGVRYTRTPNDAKRRGRRLRRGQARKRAEGERLSRSLAGNLQTRELELTKIVQVF